MKQHLGHDTLLKYEYALLSEKQNLAVAQHLEQCDCCREKLDRLKQKYASLELLREDEHVSDELLQATLAAISRPASARHRGYKQTVWLTAAVLIMAAVAGMVYFSASDQVQKVAPQPYPDVQVSPRGGSAPLIAEKDSRTAAPAAAPLPMTRLKAPMPVPPDTSPSVVEDMLKAKAVPPARKAEPGKLALSDRTDSDISPAKTASKGHIAASGINRDNIIAAGPQKNIAAVETGNNITAAGSKSKESVWIPEKPPFAPASNIELVTLPRREDVQITIYNSADLTLVREQRILTMKRGWNWLQFSWANTLIDPTSLNLEPIQYRSEISIEQLVFPPRLKNLGRWLIKSQVSGPARFEITYLTSNLSWQAFYLGTLSEDEREMTWQGFVRVDNRSGADYKNAQVRLIVGRVHLLDRIAELARRGHPFGRPEIGTHRPAYAAEAAKLLEMANKKDKSLGLFDNFRMLDAASGIRKEIKKEGLSEYFLYTIQGRETIPNGWGKRLPCLEAVNIPVQSLYKYDEERFGRRPVRFVSFANDKKHKLGKTPLPGGTIKMYRKLDKAAHLGYLGGSMVKYIPVNEKVELKLGPARYVHIKPVLMALGSTDYRFDPNDNILGWDELETWRINMENSRPIPVNVEITRAFSSSNWSLAVVSGKAGYKKHDATHVRFRLSLQPQSKEVLEYKVRINHDESRQITQTVKPSSS